MGYSDQRLCELMERRVQEMRGSDYVLFGEAARRMRALSGDYEAVVKLVELNMDLKAALDSALDQLKTVQDDLEKAKAERRILQVRDDLKIDGCAAMLRDGGIKYCVSDLQLAEMLEARRDGRMVIVPKEGDSCEQETQG